MLLQAQRDTAAAARFFRRLPTVANGVPPNRIATDELGSDAAAIAHVAELQLIEHVQARSAMRCNNRVEQAHQPTRTRERVMRRFTSVESAHRFPDVYARVGNRFRPGRHRVAAAAYRAAMCERVAMSRAVAALRAARPRLPTHDAPRIGPRSPTLLM